VRTQPWNLLFETQRVESSSQNPLKKILEKGGEHHQHRFETQVSALAQSGGRHG
jgi:hypothetical protein